MEPDQSAQQTSELSVEDRLTNLFGAAEDATESAEQTDATSSAPESEVSDDQPEQTEAAETEETQDAATDAGLVEVEWEGKTHKLAPDLKDALMRHRDYKAKTQELADLRRHATLQAEQVSLINEFNQQTAKEQSELAGLQAQINQYKQLDWSGLDADQFMRTKHGLDQLKERAGELQSLLQQKGSELKEKQGQKRQEMAKTAYDFVSKKVKGFSPNSAIEKEVASYVEAEGMPLDGFIKGTLAFPTVAIMAYKAMQYDKLQSGKDKAVQAIKKAPPVLKPGAVTASNSATQQKDKSLRDRLKKSGDIKDAAALFMHRGI